MSNYSPSTIARIADIRGGLRVETGSILATLLLDHSPSLAVDLFRVYGRILLYQLFVEVLTALSGDAAQLQFLATFTTPVIAANPLGAACASLSGAAAGVRVVHLGGAVATAAVITDSAGLSDVTCTTPQIVGGSGFVGVISSLCSAATCTSGALGAVLCYIPYSEGAYVEAIL